MPAARPGRAAATVRGNHENSSADGRADDVRGERGNSDAADKLMIDLLRSLDRQRLVSHAGHGARYERARQGCRSGTSFQIGGQDAHRPTARMAVLQFSRDLALDFLQRGLRGVQF